MQLRLDSSILTPQSRRGGPRSRLHTSLVQYVVSGVACWTQQLVVLRLGVSMLGMDVVDG